MALLYRFVKIPDRADTHVFTFIVTKSVTRDLERDITSKEFSCGHQRWAITFSRTDKVLGVYLVWRSTSEAMRVYVDFTFTLLNRDHFSYNEAFSGKQVKFTTECPAQGNRNYIAVNELYVRNFADLNGEFQLELSMGHVRTMFDTDFRVPSSIFGHHLPTARHHHQNAAKNPPQTSKLETTYFTYGGFDWNLALYPNGIKDIHDGRVSVYLNRCTGFDHQCRVRYSIVLGDGPRRVDSGPVDDVSDSDGKSYGWHTSSRFQDLVYKGAVRVHLEMLMANTLSEVVSTIVVQHAGAVASSSGAAAAATPGAGGTHGVVVAAPAVTQCYDRDKQAWSIKSDCHSETVRLHMVYKDIHNVPRNHLRYVCWMAYLLKYDEETREMVPKPLPGAPFSHYYAQENSDEGIIMETDVGVKELKEPGCPYLTDKGQMRVQVVWSESYLLFQASYHKYDDVTRTQNHQMRREIQTLQAENYSLERQLFSYQKSIAFAHSRGTYSYELTTPDGRAEDEEDHYPFEERGYHHHGLGDRTMSSDTEYA